MCLTSCHPSEKIVTDYKKVTRKVERNKRKYIKLHNKWRSTYPSIFNGDTTWKTKDTIIKDILYLSEGIIDTIIDVQLEQEVIFIEKDGAIVEVVRTITDTIENWNISVELDSFEVLRIDTISISYPVIEKIYVEKEKFFTKLQRWFLIFLVILLFLLLIRKRVK